MECVRELAAQAQALGFRPGHLVCATGSGGTAAGLFLGASQFLPGAQVHAVCVDHGPFRETILDLAAQAADLLGCPAPDPAALTVESHVGPGYAVPAPEDSPRIRELAQAEGMLLSPCTPARPGPVCWIFWSRAPLMTGATWSFSTPAARPALFAMDLA